jgi:outer membrane protein OmpA-like peptidoglycan-associated protein
VNKKLFTASLLTASMALTGCATMQEHPKTTTGAAVGAVGGAVVGGAVSGKKGALIGAAVGALAGGSIGYYMDEQERKLREQTANSGIEVQRQGDNIVLDLPDNISFDVGKAELKPAFMPSLERVAQVLQQYNETRIEIAGHTDSTGSTKTNQILSENRALAIKSYLVNRGIAPERIYAVGYGSSRPIADNATAAGRAKNRRVEITLIPTNAQ